MITESEMYWLTRLDPLNNLAAIFIGGCLGTAVLMLFSQLFLRDHGSWEDKEKIKRDMELADRLLYRGLPPLIGTVLLFSTIKAFIPTTREMAAIKIVPAVANSQAVEKLGKSAEMLIDLANSWMQELAPVKNNGKEGR